MSITKFPAGMARPADIACDICRGQITLEDATLGPADGSAQRMAYICNSHLKDGMRLIDTLTTHLADVQPHLSATPTYSHLTEAVAHGQPVH